MKLQIPLYKVAWTKEDVRAVTQVIRRGMYWTGGQENTQLEAEVSRYLDRRHGLAFNSGTSALTALLLAYDIGPGDEVIVPAFTYPATVDAVRFAGATPVFADIEEETYGLDIDDVERRITDKTKAVIAVHIYGLPCNIVELRDLVDRHGLLLIEDAAEALGAESLGVKCGSYGDGAILSFAGNKIVTTGEGGMALTDSHDIKERLVEIRKRHSWHLSTIQSALGLTQFKKLDKLLAKRRQNAHYLSNKMYRLHSIGKIRLPYIPEGSTHSYQFYTIRVESGRDALKGYLEEKGIDTKVYFPAMHPLPIAEKVASQVLTLPMYSGLKTEEMDYIAEAVREFVEV